MAEKMELTKLTLQIFSMLERQWLVDDARHHASPLLLPPDQALQQQQQQQRKKTRILSIDGGCGPPALAHTLAALVHLEDLLQSTTGDPGARIPDFFDLLAGTGTGGVLAVLLTAADRAADSKCRTIFSARDAAELLRVKLPMMYRRSSSGLGGMFRRRRRRRFSGKSLEGALHAALGALTLKDAAKPLLVPCYDLLSAAPFVFSRAGAAESPALDFELWKVCRATLATPGLFTPFRLASLDGVTACLAVDGGLVMSNPASAAVTHVLHNRAGFPDVGGAEDLLVLSLGSGGSHLEKPAGEGKPSWWFGSRSRRGVTEVEIAMGGIADAVDQILSNAFCWNPSGYLRIQGNGSLRTPAKEEGKVADSLTEEGLRRAGERMLGEKAVETLPLGGKRLSVQTNGERMEEFVRRRLLSLGSASVTAGDRQGEAQGDDAPAEQPISAMHGGSKHCKCREKKI